MIIEVNENNILEAATVHSISWKESHRSFCSEDLNKGFFTLNQGVECFLADGKGFVVL